METLPCHVVDMAMYDKVWRLQDTLHLNLKFWSQCIYVHKLTDNSVALCFPDVGEETAPSKRWLAWGLSIFSSEKRQSVSVCKYIVNIV
jgi:hypothetical protein